MKKRFIMSLLLLSITPCISFAFNQLTLGWKLDYNQTAKVFLRYPFALYPTNTINQYLYQANTDDPETLLILPLFNDQHTNLATNSRIKSAGYLVVQLDNKGLQPPETQTTVNLGPYLFQHTREKDRAMGNSLHIDYYQLNIKRHNKIQPLLFSYVVVVSSEGMIDQTTATIIAENKLLAQNIIGSVVSHNVA